jgi:hypothetical protein
MQTVVRVCMKWRRIAEAAAMRRKEAEEWAARKAANEVARQQEAADAEVRRWKAEEQAATRATEEAAQQMDAAEAEKRRRWKAEEEAAKVAAAEAAQRRERERARTEVDTNVRKPNTLSCDVVRINVWHATYSRF